MATLSVFTCASFVQVAVLTPSASIRVQRASFSTSHPPAVTTRGGTALQDLHWEFAMKMQRDGCRVTAASGDGATSSNLTQPYDTPTNSPDTYNESWPSSCCSSQQTPPSRIKATPTNTQAPPTINSGALVFEDEGEKRGASLARYEAVACGQWNIVVSFLKLSAM